MRSVLTNRLHSLTLQAPPSHPESPAMSRAYSMSYERKGTSGATVFGSVYVERSSDEDLRKEIIQDQLEQNKEDPSYKVLSIVRMRKNGIDWELQDRMRAVREICELGHRVRADVKLRNRQPLKKAYVIFSDPDVHQYMVYADCQKMEYTDIIASELNVMDVEFVDDKDKFFDYNLKPNFRVLGPKGMGPMAQKLKLTLSSMTNEDRKILLRQLKNGGGNVDGIVLAEEDVEVEYVAKSGFASANSKFGAIILDTTLDKDLLDLGFVAEFRSSIQNIRKDAGLEITDKVFIEVFCLASKANTIERHSGRLKKDLLATDIQIFPPEEVDKLIAHEMMIDGTVVYANVFKELEG